MKKARVNRVAWCDRTLLRASTYIGLCVSAKHFVAELKRLKVAREEWPQFLLSDAHATTHFLEGKHGRCAIVCINPDSKYSLIQVHALLVHEAVHVWQDEREHIGEKHPGCETEAYAIQHISQSLMLWYGKLTG